MTAWAGGFWVPNTHWPLQLSEGRDPGISCSAEFYSLQSREGWFAMSGGGGAFLWKLQCMWKPMNQKR